MKDRTYRVSWPTGEMVLHGTTDKELIEIALEYLRQAGKIKIELVEAVTEPVVSAI